MSPPCTRSGLKRRSLLLATPPALLALTSRPARALGAPEISGEAARRDLRILKRAFEALHPGLYRYTTPEQLAATFAAGDPAVAGGASRAEMFIQASRIAASVHCGHTWTNPWNQRQDVVDGLFKRRDKLPLTLRWIEGRALVTGSAAAAVPVGAELLAIDGRRMADIAAALLPCLRADGLHEGARGKRWSQLDSGPNGGAMDRLFPLRFAPDNGRYRLSIVPRGETAPHDVEVPAISEAERDSALPSPSQAWRFDAGSATDAATLTLPTFAFWRSDFKPADFLARSFEALREQPSLIIDLRSNEGGSDVTGRLVLSHLLRAPLQLPGYRVESAYERAPYELMRFLDTWDYGFFDRTGQARKGPGRNWLLPDSPGVRVEPVATPYTGRTLVLIGPQNSSAGYLLARDIKASGAATLLGQPTGGNLRGLNGGQLAWINLPASGVGVDIPLVAAFAPEGTPDAGVLPDIAIAPRFADAQAGIDTEMQAARARLRAAPVIR